MWARVAGSHTALSATVTKLNTGSAWQASAALAEHKRTFFPRYLICTFSLGRLLPGAPPERRGPNKEAEYLAEETPQVT